MVGYLRRSSQRWQIGSALFLACLAALGARTTVNLAGTKTGLVLTAGFIFGPVMFYAAVMRPMAFPFLVYLAITPFDNILAFSSFGTLTKLVAIASAAAMLFYMLRRKRMERPSRVMFVWIVLYTWMFATTFWAIDTPSSFQLLPTAVQLFALYGIVSLMPVTNRQLRAVAVTIVIGFACAAAYGAYVFHSGQSIDDRLTMAAADDSSFIDPNHFAAALLLPIALAITGALRAPRLAGRAGYLTAIVAMLAGLAVSSSRGALLGLIAMVVYMFFRTSHRKQLGAVLALMAAGGCAMFGPLVSRFGSAASTGGAGRVDIWRVGWLAFKHHWFAGAGYNNFAFAYDREFINVAQHYYTRWHRAPHDILLSTGVELGVVGVVLLLLAWFGHFHALRRIGVDDERFGLRVAVEAALIGVFIAALFLDLLTMKYTWLIFMLAVLVRNAKPDPVVVHASPIEQNGEVMGGVIPGESVAATQYAAKS